MIVGPHCCNASYYVRIQKMWFFIYLIVWLSSHLNSRISFKILEYLCNHTREVYRYLFGEIDYKISLSGIFIVYMLSIENICILRGMTDSIFIHSLLSSDITCFMFSVGLEYECCYFPHFFFK